MAANFIDDVNKALEAEVAYLALYGEVMDQAIPWKTYEDAVKDVERDKHHYSAAAATFVGSVQTLLMDAQDGYHSSMQIMYNWCEYTRQIFAVYVQLISDPDKAEISPDEKAMVHAAFDESIAALSSTVAVLDTVLRKFNEASVQLAALASQLHEDFSEESAWRKKQTEDLCRKVYEGAVLGPFGLTLVYAAETNETKEKMIFELNQALARTEGYFENLQNAVTGSQNDIASTKVRLQHEADTVGKLQTSAKVTETVAAPLSPELKTVILEKANTLITVCFDYQARHGKTGQTE